MRFLLGISILAIAACSGASSSSDLFGSPPAVVTERDASPTEPNAPPESAPEDPPADEPPTKPVRDASAPPKDASIDAPAVDAGPAGEACSFDTDCTIDDQVCNWKTDTCAAPGPLGAPCKRDLECSDGLCNWKLTECSDPAPAGTPCRRNKECASGACSANSICK